MVYWVPMVPASARIMNRTLVRSSSEHNRGRDRFLLSANSVETMSKKHFSIEEAKKIGEALDIDWIEFDVEQFIMGLNVELEHGRIDPETNVTNDDPIMTGKIALAHLNEFPDYYTRLDKLEEEAKKFHRKQKTLK